MVLAGAYGTDGTKNVTVLLILPVPLVLLILADNTKDMDLAGTVGTAGTAGTVLPVDTENAADTVGTGKIADTAGWYCRYCW